MHPSGSGPAEIRLGLPARWLAGRSVVARVAVSDGARGELELAGSRLPLVAEGPGLACRDLPPILVPAGMERLELVLRVTGSAVPSLALDALLVSPGRPEND